MHASGTSGPLSHVAATPSRLLQVSKEDVSEAAVVEDVPDPAEPMCLHTNLGPDTMSSTLYSPSSHRRRVHDSGPTVHLVSYAGRPGSPQGVYHGRGHTDGKGTTARSCLVPLRTKRLSGPCWRTRCMYRHPLPLFQLQPRAKRAADGVTKTVRALGRAEMHTEWGNLLLKKLSQGAGAIELMVDILPVGVPRIARHCRFVGVLQLARGRLPSKPHARRGSRAAAPRNGRTTKVPSLCLFDPVPGIVLQELAAEADVFLVRACCS